MRGVRALIQGGGLAHVHRDRDGCTSWPQRPPPPCTAHGDQPWILDRLDAMTGQPFLSFKSFRQRIRFSAVSPSARGRHQVGPFKPDNVAIKRRVHALCKAWHFSRRKGSSPSVRGRRLKPARTCMTFSRQKLPVPKLPKRQGHCNLPIISLIAESVISCS